MAVHVRTTLVDDTRVLNAHTCLKYDQPSSLITLIILMPQRTDALDQLSLIVSHIL